MNESSAVGSPGFGVAWTEDRKQDERPQDHFMNATSIESDSGLDVPSESRQQLLELARSLDRFGRSAETFLCEQFELLERGIDEFEREKAAWRRQLRRESSQLALQREELERLQAQASSDGSTPDVAALSVQKKRATAAAARASGLAPIKILLRPREATSMQIGQLLFEISKLNRKMGGRGVRFEAGDVRKPVKRLFRWSGETGASGKILEVTGFSVLPLEARGSHVSLDVDTTDRLEGWISFKTWLFQSSLCNSDLATEFLTSKPVNDNPLSHMVNDANRQVDDADFPATAYSSTSLCPYTPINAIQQQLERLESCYESLRSDRALLVHIDSAAIT